MIKPLSKSEIKELNQKIKELFDVEEFFHKKDKVVREIKKANKALQDAKTDAAKEKAEKKLATLNEELEGATEELRLAREAVEEKASANKPPDDTANKRHSDSAHS